MRDRSVSAREAQLHHEDMCAQFPNEIRECINNTRILNVEDDYFYKLYLNEEDKQEKIKARIKVVPVTTSKAVELYRKGRTCVLNFASFSSPGGGFLKGMLAQEEALCRDSILYEVLSAFDDSYYEDNRGNMNRGLYHNRALYSPDIVFFGDPNCKVDVLTCASPNWRGYSRNGGVSYFNNAALFDRVGFVLFSMMNHNVDTMILGAWGCGVFRQDAALVAKFFRDWITALGIEKDIIFAIPDDSSYNFEAFSFAFQ